MSKVIYIIVKVIIRAHRVDLLLDEKVVDKNKRNQAKITD